MEGCHTIKGEKLLINRVNFILLRRSLVHLCSYLINVCVMHKFHGSKIFNPRLVFLIPILWPYFRSYFMRQHYVNYLFS
jgi:hypothetical protein